MSEGAPLPRSRATKLFHFQLSTRTSAAFTARENDCRRGREGNGFFCFPDEHLAERDGSRSFSFFRREFFSFDMRGKFQIFEISGIIKGERKGNPLTVSIRPEARNRNRIKTNLQRQHGCLKKDSISVLLDSLLARRQSSRLHLSATIFPKNFPRK